MNYPRFKSARKSNLFSFIMYLVAPLLASCAAPVTDNQWHGKKEDLEVYISNGLRPLSVFQLMRSGDEVWLKGPVKRPATEGRKPRLLDSSKVHSAISVIAQAYHSGAIGFSVINDFSETYEQAMASTPGSGKHSASLTYLEIDKGIFKLSDGKHGGLILDPDNNWVFRAPVRYASNAITALDSAQKRIAFADCGDYPKENNACTVSAYHLETRSTEPLTELAGNVEDMKFSCDGKNLYILMREFSVKSGPIDSLFALAGHPNSDNYYRLIIFSMRDRSETVLDVKGEYSPGGGYLVSNCSEMG